MRSLDDAGDHPCGGAIQAELGAQLGATGPSEIWLQPLVCAFCGSLEVSLAALMLPRLHSQNNADWECGVFLSLRVRTHIHIHPQIHSHMLAQVYTLAIHTLILMCIYTSIHAHTCVHVYTSTRLCTHHTHKHACIKHFVSFWKLREDLGAAGRCSITQSVASDCPCGSLYPLSLSPPHLFPPFL